MKKLRIGIIGTGGIANNHIKAYLALPDVEVVGGADIVPGKARAFLDSYELTNAKAFESADELLKMELDAVSVCTYNTTHAECTVKALEAGVHVLCEKPMSVTLSDALLMARAEKKSGKILTIGFQPRYDENSKYIKEIVKSGKLGDVYYVQSGGGRRRGIPRRSFIDKNLAGVGSLADIGCYALDFGLNTIGYPKPLTVSAVTYDYFGTNPKYFFESERFTVDDFAAAFIRLEGGVTFDFRISWAMHMDTCGDFIFLGKDAGLKVKQPNLLPWGGAWDGPVGEITLMHDDANGNPSSTPIPLKPMEKSNLFFKKIESFVDAVRNAKPAPIPTSQIIYNQAIIDGIIRSAECGHEVDIVIPTI